MSGIKCTKDSRTSHLISLMMCWEWRRKNHLILFCFVLVWVFFSPLHKFCKGKIYCLLKNIEKINKHFLDGGAAF